MSTVNIMYFNIILYAIYAIRGDLFNSLLLTSKEFTSLKSGHLLTVYGYGLLFLKLTSSKRYDAILCLGISLQDL